MAVKGKLTPAEFLAALKGRKPPSKPATARSSDEVDDLDLSDLQNAPKGEGSDEEESRADSAEDAVHDALSSGDHMSGSRYIGHYVKRSSRLSELFDRVNTLLSNSNQQDSGQTFRPKAPETLEETGLTFEEIERLILKFLLAKGSRPRPRHRQPGAAPVPDRRPDSETMQAGANASAFKGAAEMGDYDFAITEFGRERARRYSEECTYFGSAPVTLPDYLQAMAAQTHRQAASDRRGPETGLQRSDGPAAACLDRLGPAINSGRGMFLFGNPGNGKTSIAERVTRSFGTTIWIPRTLGIDGDIIRLYDPGMHDAVEVGSAPKAS